MRVLANIITFNDADVVEQVLDALRHQTRPVDGILIADNASTDATLDRPLDKNVTVVRHSENRGPSGAARTGFSHAVQHGFDWIWVLDADSVPEPDALENLLVFFNRLPGPQREQLCFLGSLPRTDDGGIKQPPITLARATVDLLPLASDQAFTECDCALWSGCLFWIAAVTRIGLPTADYVADMGEIEYGFRARQLGFTSYIVHNSVIRHDVGRPPGVAVTRACSIGHWTFPLRELSPWRAYYSSRNALYFWLYQYRPRQPWSVLRAIVQALLSPIGFALRPVSHHRQLIATLRGLWHGLTAQMWRRY